MSQRLQVVVGDSELRRFRRAARRSGMTLSEWVRQTLRRAEGEVATGDQRPKLDAIRAASRHTFPTGDIDQMLAEIEQAHGAGLPE